MFKSKKYILIFLLPSLIGFSIFYIIPFIGGFVYSILNNAFEMKFIGFANYINVINNEMFRLAFKNTVLFTAISVPLLIAISFFLALLLQNEDKKFGFVRTGIVLPLTIPSVSVVFVWQLLFADKGYINHLTSFFGAGSTSWLSSNYLYWPIIILYIWRNCGYDMILFLAGFKTIPRELYEVSAIDGANWWTTAWHITFPLLFPSAFFILIISIINSFKIFKETYLLAGSYPPDSVYLMQHFMNNQFHNFDYEKLTSAAYLFALLIYFLVIVLFKSEEKFSKEVEL